MDMMIRFRFLQGSLLCGRRSAEEVGSESAEGTSVLLLTRGQEMNPQASELEAESAKRLSALRLSKDSEISRSAEDRN